MYPGAHVESQPDKLAVVMADTGAGLTYAQLEDRSVRLDHVLHDHGLRVGDAFALLSENSPLHYECYWAALRSGRYVVPLNHHLSVDELVHILTDSGARVLVASAAMGDKAAQAVERCPDVTLALAVGAAVAGFEDYEAALAAASPVPFDVQPAGLDMGYSSGTTGVPKGVRPTLPSRQVTEPGDLLRAVFAPMYGFDEDTVYLSPGPLYHAAPLRFGGIIHMVGGTDVVMPRFDAVKALEYVEQYGVTHSQWVPTMFVRMLKLTPQERAAHDLSTHRVAVHAAAPCPVEVKQQMIDWWGPILHEYYAATEAAGVTLIGSGDWLTHRGSVGKAGLGVLHVCDEGDPDQPELPAGEDGLVYIERDAMPFTYHRDPEKTRQAQHPHHDTWATTGDIGHVDEEGYLYLTDRRAFMIISGGVNIYPQEIENALTMHPAVYDVAVIGVPDPEMGEQVKAVVQVAEGVVPSDALAAELVEHVRGRIAHYKAPRSVDFVDSLPRSATGKMVKGRLRAQYDARTTA